MFLRKPKSEKDGTKQPIQMDSPLTGNNATNCIPYE